jgi:hypothetical protein
MSINILETVQQHLGYPALQKIDANTQQVVIDEKTPDEDKFSQAAIPAVLTALYKYVQEDEKALEFLNAGDSYNWAGKIFEDHKTEAIQTIATYANKSKADTIVKLNVIANEAVKSVKENLPAHPAVKEVKTFFSHQINTILLYLPAELNMGELLHDNTLDDKTNKMGGLMSGLIQSIGNVFSSPVSDEAIKK